MIRNQIRYKSSAVKLVPHCDYLKKEPCGKKKAKLYIVLVKEDLLKDIKDYNYPLSFWYYFVGRRECINNSTAKYMFKIHGTNTHTCLLGDAGDISKLCK